MRGADRGLEETKLRHCEESRALAGRRGNLVIEIASSKTPRNDGCVDHL
jgi:hypothetical protein